MRARVAFPVSRLSVVVCGWGIEPVEREDAESQNGGHAGRNSEHRVGLVNIKSRVNKRAQETRDKLVETRKQLGWTLPTKDKRAQFSIEGTRRRELHKRSNVLCCQQGSGSQQRRRFIIVAVDQGRKQKEREKFCKIVAGGDQEMVHPSGLISISTLYFKYTVNRARLRMHPNKNRNNDANTRLWGDLNLRTHPVSFPC